jgi:hypothetical protein
MVDDQPGTSSTGVIDQDVDLAEILECLFDRSFCIFFDGDIHLYRKAGPSLILDFPNQFFHSLPV